MGRLHIAAFTQRGQTTLQGWVQNHYPERHRKVINVLDAHRQKPVGRTLWSVSMRGTGVFADLLSQRFAIASRKVGFDHE